MDTIINLFTNAETQSNGITTNETHLLPDFPLVTIEDFLKFEADLKMDKEIRKQFVNIFLYILFHLSFTSNIKFEKRKSNFESFFSFRPGSLVFVQ